MSAVRRSSSIRLMRVAVAAGEASLLALLAGCSSGGGRQPTGEGVSAVASASAAPRPTATAAVTEKARPADDLKSAPFAVKGREYVTLARVRSVPTTGRALGQVALTPDGLFVVSVYDPKKEQNALRHGRLGPHRMALFDPRTKTLDYLPRLEDHGPNRQTVWAAATRRWVVWTETTSMDLYTDPWVLFSYDRRTGRTRQIATAPLSRRGRRARVAMNGSAPTLAGNGRVFLAAAYGRGHNIHTGVYSVPVDGSAPLRREVDAADSPVATGHWLYYLTRQGKNTRLHRRNLKTGTHVTLQDGLTDGCPRIVGVAANARVVAWSDRCGHGHNRVVIQDGTDRGHRVVIDNSHGKLMGYLQATSRYIGFGVGTGPYKEYFYDLKRHQLFRFGHGRGSGVLSGNKDMFVSCTYLGGDRCHNQLVKLK